MRDSFAQLSGETFRNADSSDRQAIIQKCAVGELLDLEHEPDNPADINAIRVRRCQPFAERETTSAATWRGK